MNARRRFHPEWGNIAFLSATHVLGIGGTIAYLLLVGPSAAAFILLGAFGIATGLSVTGGYHRLFAHGTYEARWPVRLFYLIFGAAAFENSALKWSSDHRRHHARVDTESDPYNIRRGFWWAHIVWVLTRDDQADGIRHVGDLERDPLVRWQDRYYGWIAFTAGIALPGALGALFGDVWGGLAVAAFLRIVLIHHATFCVNSVAHAIGWQPYSMTDSSRDSFLTALITMGEGYHNFHHTFPTDYRNGHRWWHFDPTKWAVRAMSWLGLTRKLQAVPELTILRARLQTEEQRAAHVASSPRAAALKEKLEHLLAAWQRLVEEYHTLRDRLNRRALAPLRRMMAEKRRDVIDAYRAWRLALAAAAA